MPFSTTGRTILCRILTAGFALGAAQLAAQNAAPVRIDLAAGWRIQSSASVSATADAISSPGFRTDGWTAATIPSTVVAALVANGTYKDPYVGMNLRAIPGMDSYPIGANFVHTDMKPTSPFA
ncbi:MAG TPA: hypothetical protein VE967_13535, partial [Gemmatimonadaceae bacterium]|nr:hypothetical protein [Gemmatimonadaceae bacterium]